MHTSKIKSPASIALFSSVLLSMGSHFYLLNEFIKAKYTSDPLSSICNISSYFNCGASIGSNYSEVFGTPLAVFGILVQLVILFFALKALVLDRPEKANISSQITLTVAGFSVVVSLLMATISLTIIKSLCPFCTAAYVFSFITLFAAWKLFFKDTSRSGWTMETAKGLVFAGLFLVFSGFLTGKMLTNKYQDKDTQDLLPLVVDDWKKQPLKNIDVIAPIKSGPESAKMKIVEFADFLCSHCKAAFPRLKAFVHENKDTQLLFQAFPLDGCRGPANSPGRQCELAIVTYCANLQDKGESAMEYIFNSQQLFAETKDMEKQLGLMATMIGVNSKTLLECTKDVNSLEMIKKQLELGKQLEIQGTPTIFVNGKRLQGAPNPITLQEVYKSL